QFWNRPLVWNAKSEPKKCQAARAGRKAGLECFAWLSTLPANLKKLSGTTSFKRLGGRMTDLMTNKSYVITTSLMRIGLLTAQIAMSPSAATQTMPANARQQPALRERETNLALSAYPPIVKHKTAVYVVKNSGYLKLRGSDNGSSASVQRAFATSGPAGVEESGTTGTGRIDYLCEIVSTAKPQIDGGTVKPVAIMTKERSPALPSVPTGLEQGTPNLEAYTWN